jgi:phosphoribosylanthranilate isomerase
MPTPNSQDNMTLKYISITGADDQVSIGELVRLSKVFPLVEWAILYYPSRTGENRNPSPEWRREFLGRCAFANKAAHLCATAVPSFVDEGLDFEPELRQFQRIQLNFTRERLTEERLPQLVSRVRQEAGTSFMTQENGKNAGVTELFAGVPNHQILFDASAGHGVSPDQWPVPVAGKFCGYAGGLSPANIDFELDRIQRAAGRLPYWIDMESGVRTENHFDLGKVGLVLENVYRTLGR